VPSHGILNSTVGECPRSCAICRLYSQEPKSDTHGLRHSTAIGYAASSLREVIPFPKTAKAIDLMMDVPTPVRDKQLKDLGIAVGIAVTVPKR
jgi:hypothetical protein